MGHQLSSFGLPGKGAATRQAKNIAEAAAIAAESHRRGFPAIPIGKGTNCAFLEAAVPAVFLRSTDVSLNVREKGSKILVTVGAGLSWDAFVRFAVAHSWSGAECLSGIPGTCGAAPVQNIGAYGASLSDILQSLEVLDLKTLRARRLSRADCGFGYRTSIFNTTARGRFFIASITLRLNKIGPTKPRQRPAPVALPNYPDLRAALSLTPSLTEIRNAVLLIRRQKLPDYRKIPNCGSFFKNPIVSAALAKQFLKRNPAVPHWPEPDGRKVKLSAAWLIENSGVRNKHWGKIKISPQHALILINAGETDHEYLKKSVASIVTAVKNKFKIALEPEPNLLNRVFVKNILAMQR